MDNKSLSHTKWECKYHIVFIPKYRKKKMYGAIRKDLGEEFHRLAGQKESKILEGHMLNDHIHILIEIPPKYLVAQVVRYIKGPSALYISKAVWRTTKILYGAAYVGTRVFCFDGGT